MSFEVFGAYFVEVIQKTFYYWLTICRIGSIFLWTSLPLLYNEITIWLVQCLGDIVAS